MCVCVCVCVCVLNGEYEVMGRHIECYFFWNFEYWNELRVHWKNSIGDCCVGMQLVFVTRFIGDVWTLCEQSALFPLWMMAALILTIMPWICNFIAKNCSTNVVKFITLKCHEGIWWSFVELFCIHGGMEVSIVICASRLRVSARKYKMRIKKCTSR